MRLIVGAALLASGALIALPANAAVIERTVNLDLNALNLPAATIPTDGQYVYSGIDPISLNAGDTFVLHYRFGGDRLRVVDGGAPSYEYFGWNLFEDNFNKTGYTWTTKFDFEAPTGSLLTNHFTYSFGGPLGAFLPNVNLTDTSFSFSGITLTFYDIRNFREDQLPFTTDVIGFNALFSSDDGLFIQNPRQVPEPDSLALFGLGVAGLLCVRTARWRQRSG